MGCAQSRIENEEAVVRCKERREHMKAAVACRNAFAVSHCAYAFSLLDTGAALSEFAHGEGVPPPAAAAPEPKAAGGTGAASSPSPIDEEMPPPIDTMLLPLPEFSPSTGKIHSDSIREEDELEDQDATDDDDSQLDNRHHAQPASPPPPPLDPKATEDDEIVPDPEDGNYVPASPPPPPPPAPIPSSSYDDEEELRTPPPSLPPKHPKKNTGKGKAKNKEVHHQHTESAPRVDLLLRVLKEVDDSFLRASESAKEVSTLLEANRMHYHSNAKGQGQY
jgi:hypothetical protein